MKRNRVFGGLIRLAIVLVMLAGPLSVFASDWAVAIVDVDIAEDGITLAPGGSADVDITISVTGAQAGTATYKVYQKWDLDESEFQGTNAQTFTVGSRVGGASADIEELSVSISVVPGHVPGDYPLVIGVFDITNTNTTGAKLDNGSTAVLTVTVEAGVIYDFDGFFRPVVMGEMNRVRAGSAVPMKFSLGGDQGLDIFGEGSPSSRRIACPGTTNGNDVAETMTAGGSSLNCDLDADQYNYVWKTDRNWAGTCRVFELGLNDGSSHQVSFEFK